MASEDENDGRPVAVFDTGLILQATLRPLGPAGAVFDALEGGQVRLFLSRDSKNEPVLNLAIETQARYIVTRDNDLLDLMGDEGFRRRFPALDILEPVAFLRVLRGRRFPELREAPREESDAGREPERGRER